nr:reverse transcriptase domain-containing protein [Tanacetum cinerariifolium]
MVQTRNSENNNPPDPIATQLAAIAAKLEVFETMKEDIVALKEGEQSRSRSSRNGEGESSWRGRQPQRPYNKINFLIFSSGDPRGWLMKSKKYFRMAPTKTSTFVAPAMTQASIWQLVADSVVATLEAQAANMENVDNTNRNPKPREVHVARKCSYKEFMSYRPFNFKGAEGAVGLIHWFERSESVFSCSNYTKDYKVKFSTGTLTKEALSWWNSFA